MTGPALPGDDDALLAELAAALEPDLDPPDDVLRAARASFTWRTIDAEIAMLTYDSLLDGSLASIRAADQPRILTFEADALTIEFEVESMPSGRRLVGQLMPEGEAELELLSAGVVLTAGYADDLGRFILALPPAPSRVTVRCRLSDGTTVASALVSL